MTTNERHTVRVAVYLILIKDNKILLMRRYNTGWNDGNYSVPAGHIDGNESITQATIREAREEIGITVNKNDLDVVHVMHVQSNHEYICFFLQAKKWDGEPKLMETDKCDDVQWFPLNDLPKNLSENLHAAIESYKKRIFYSEKGWN